jgi:rSAM/selenodomain-associated transferase 1
MSSPAAPRRVLALFAKAPVAGQVKTRLSPRLSPEQAASLYEAMLEDIAGQHAEMRDCTRALWFWPEDARPYFARFAAQGGELHAQVGADLAARMAHLFRAHHAAGYERIVLRGTDSPTLPAARVREAFGALEHAPVVLCPDRDGGYNLVGLRAPCDALFALELSHAGVLAQTLERARAQGLRADLLPGHHDVDTFADLERVALELDDTRTPRTRRVWRSLA